jgi:hypothetical protein
MSIVKKSVFEAKFYFGTILKGYVYTTLDNGRGTVKEEATALRITGEEGNIKIIFNKKIITPTFSLYFREYYNPLFKMCI